MAGQYRRPVTAADRRRQAEQREAKLAALHERLHAEVTALRSGEDWTRWLDVARRFHTYSFRNTLLIAAQRPDATLVAGYDAWRQMGRQVDKGQKGIQILAPVTRPVDSTAVVFKARDLRLDRPVGLKVLAPKLANEVTASSL